MRTTLDEICARGPARLTLDKVAAESGIAKTTIYRRWANKNDLIVDAIDLLRSAAPIPDSGDTRADLIVGLDNMLRVFTSPHGKAIGAVYAERLFDERLAEAWAVKIAGPHHGAFTAILDHGLQTGQIHSAIHADELAIIIGATAFQVLFGEQPNRPGLAADVINTVFDGIGTRTTGNQETEGN